MTTLLASLIGFISSIIPEVLRFIKDSHDKKHELNIMDRQISFSKKSEEIKEIPVNYDLIAQAQLYSTYHTGISWVDGFNGMVRPILAYSFFILYSVAKFLQYKAILSAPTGVYLDIIWSSEDQAIFAGIISFYFGQRTFSKMRNK